MSCYQAGGKYKIKLSYFFSRASLSVWIKHNFFLKKKSLLWTKKKLSFSLSWKILPILQNWNFYNTLKLVLQFICIMSPVLFYSECKCFVEKFAYFYFFTLLWLSKIRNIQADLWFIRIISSILFYTKYKCLVEKFVFIYFLSYFDFLSHVVP